MPTGGGGRGRAVEVAIRLLPAAAGLGVVLLAAAWTADRAAAPATAWLGLVAAAGLAPLLLVVARERLPLALVALLAPLAAIYAPRQGALPLALLAALLAAALALVATERARAGAPSSTTYWLALTLPAAVVLHADRLWSGSLGLRDLPLLAAPIVAAPLLAILDRAGEGTGRGALLAAAALVAAGPGFAFGSLALLAAIALATLFRPSLAPLAPLAVALAAFGHEPAWAALTLCALSAACAVRPAHATRLAPVAGVALGLVALGALLAAAPPWSRPQPVASMLEAAARSPLSRTDALLDNGSVALSANEARATWNLWNQPVRALVIESFVSDGAALTCGRPFATVRIAAAGGEVASSTLTIGADGGEWASGRPDVAAVLGCATLEPHAQWLPAQGRFLGRTFRAHIALEALLAAETVEIERAADLPPEVRVHLERVAVEW